jgi:hypothetical protein
VIIFLRPRLVPLYILRFSADIIKEVVLNLLDHETLDDTERHFDQMRVWIRELEFSSLKSWYNRLASRWDWKATYY